MNMNMFDIFDVFVMQYRIRLTKLQKVLLIVLYLMLIIASARYGYALVGHRILFHTVERWMVLMETMQQIVIFPIVCMMITRIPEK